ncbi:MAG: J domain-containing protein, partial [Acetobacteraceae bacterium]
MTSDPLGYYARLGVAPDSAPSELKAAFRRQARRLHPDAPGTGDAAGFVRLKEAYDVLADPARRAAYHRAGATAIPAPRPADPLPPGRRGLWLAVIAAGVIGAIVAMIAVLHAPPPRAATVLPIRSAAPLPPPPPLVLVGEPDHYVLPGDGPAVVWHLGPAGVLARLGALTAFAPVHASSGDAPEGLTGVTLEGGLVGYVDAGRLMDGGAAAARRARCAWFAGAPPANAEVLAAGAHG